MSPSGSQGERTEKATPKKRRDERENGNVMRSQDFATAALLLGTIGLLRITLPAMGRTIRLLIHRALPGPLPADGVPRIHEIMGYFREILLLALKALMPLFLFGIAAAMLVHVLQTGFMWTTKTLAVKPERLNPVSGMKRIFSSRMVAEMVKSVAKIAIVLLSVYGTFRADIVRVAALIRYDLPTACAMLTDRIFRLAFQCAIILLGLAVLDYVYQWWKYEKDIRMTKQEVKDEMKNMEGNPQNRGRIRQIQRSMSTQRMMLAVPEAMVVITNPTHYAVALRYDPPRDAAPVVLAKGRDLVAKRIRRIAREHGVAMVENRPLARSLYVHGDLNRPIPYDLYAAVAEVLAYVTRLQREQEGFRA